MVDKIGSASWHGNLPGGHGLFKLDSSPAETKNAFKVQYDNETGTNPEAMLGAAQAGCYSLVLSMLLSRAGYEVKEIDTTANVTVGNGPEGYGIQGIKLITNATVDNISVDDFSKYLDEAKNTCLICKALSAVNIELEANLVNS